MKTTFRTRQPYSYIFLECARKHPCNSPVKPVRFIEKMKTNQGSISMISGMGLDEDGVERKNPVFVALGDSVTAGHFESLLPTDPEVLKALMKKVMQVAMSKNLVNGQSAKDAGKKTEKVLFKSRQPIEITDSRESYVEKFREMLIDKYELTSVSGINAGIAGDNLISMVARSDRDVIRYQPDLVLINGSLNWDENLGTTAQYKVLLKNLVQKIKRETTADIVILTPNGDLPNTIFGNVQAPMPTTLERVQAIRELAVEEQVCLADVYAVWEAARYAGCPWKELLANGVNHPGVEGHEVYAITLMKLME